MIRALLASIAIAMTASVAFAADEARQIKILFLGDNGHHRPSERFRQIEPVLEKRGIELEYTDEVTDLNEQRLAAFDGLIVYANTTRISPDQEKVLLDFVEGGKGFIPIHCASYCFLNSPKYIALVGAQFQKHGTGTFRTTIAEPDHDLMKGFAGFESWDETYVHTKHQEDGRTVLEYRAEGDGKEPWTWVRTQGKGRVFYTAWGHDHRTWGNPGFQDLIERGIRWATHREPISTSVAASVSRPPFAVPKMTAKRDDVKPFEYIDVGKKIPNYTRSRQWGTQGEPFSKMQTPLPPEESMKHMVVPEGFRVELFAAEPDIGGKPISMNWDERGRLWIAETYDYPNELQPAGQGRDRIRICEDTDGDWRADKFTVFAEKLSIPTSLIFSRGGVIVFDGTQTIYLKDTNGDDKADERRVLFGTWSQRDTHGGPSNMQYGLDNWIWAMQGYNPSRLNVGGETHEFRQGFLRFKPDASKLEFVRSTDNNTWGLGISEEGIIFGSTANRNPSVYMPIPNRYYEAVRGWAPSLVLRMISDSYLFNAITDKVRQVDQHGGYTAAAGHAIYTARNYPEDYWNRVAFVTEPTGHLVGGFVLRREGSDFRSTNSFNLLASDDEWTAPIMAEVGPDGNVWVIDWYNYIVQHNPTPQGFRTGKGAAYESDLRDKKHGRIYRIVYAGSGQDKEIRRGGDKESGSPSGFTLAGASPQKLVETLKNDNLFWRRHAQRLLVERGNDDVVPALIELASDQSVDKIGLNVGAIHAMWTLHGLGSLDGSKPEATSAAVAALKHPSAGVRRNAVQVLPRDAKSVTAILEAKLLGDEDPQVRLMALLALADQPATAEAGAAIVAVASDSRNSSDTWLFDAMTCAAAKNCEHFLHSLSSASQPSAKLLALARTVADHHARGAPNETVGALIAGLAEAPPESVESVAQGLSKGWPKAQPPALNDKLEESLDRLLARVPRERRGAVIQLAIGWGSQRFQEYAAESARALLAQVEDKSRSSEQRIAAARDLVGQQPANKETIASLLNLVTPQAPPDVAEGILRALAASQATDAGGLIVARLADLSPSARTTALGVLLARPQWTQALLDSAEQGGVQLAELSLDQKQALAEHPDRGVRRRAQRLLSRGGALPDPDRQKVLDELLPITKVAGDAEAGKTVYKNQCAKCHVHSGEGTRIGPDLTGMAVHPKSELLVNILDPSRAVEGNFRVYTVTSTDGTVLTGLLASESRTAIEIFDAEGKKHTLLREDVEDLKAGTKSLMPDGFEKQVSQKDLGDLLEFLTQRGKYLPLPLDKVATVTSARGMFFSEEARGERLVFDDWKPKTFDGVPFQLVDPQEGRTRNVILLYGPQGSIPPRMPKSVTLPCGGPAKAIHLLSGVSGWGHPYTEKGSVSMIVRLHYTDGKTEDHPLKNGEHFADYIRRVDVPESRHAFDLRGRQIRYLKVEPKSSESIREIEFVKGSDSTAPVVMAITVEGE
jgi:putative membrane-bound dehydrogenase-like protein